MPARLTITIPGDPIPQGRGRIITNRRTGKPGIKDPERSATWKGIVQVHYMSALRAAGLERPLFAAGIPVELRVVAVFPCPRSDHRKRDPVGRRPNHKDQGDASNVLKAIEDAGNRVLWMDDCQVARVTVEKWIAAQDEAPFVQVTVQEWSWNS